jgi:hypothetical protein
MGNVRISLIPGKREGPGSRFGKRGFTLIEVLVTLCFVTVAALGCLSLAALAVKTYQLSCLRWKQTLGTWNQTQQLRSDAWIGEESGEVIAPGSVPLRRFEIRTEGETEPQVWEVLHAKK